MNTSSSTTNRLPISTIKQPAIQPVAQPLSYLEQLAKTPSSVAISSPRYSCYLLAQGSLEALAMHIHMLHAAIVRHRYMYALQPKHAYVSSTFHAKLLAEIERLSGESIPDTQTYAYRFVLGRVDELVQVHLAQSMPAFLKEIREIGLPNNAVICVH